MKNTLILIFLIPIFVFGQDDCGKHPIDPFAFKAQVTSSDMQSSIGRKYLRDLKNYHKCVFKDIDIPLNIDKNTKLVEFEEVIKAEGMNKDEIYFSIKEWFASSKNITLNQSTQNYNEKDKLFEVDDAEKGIIITQMHHEIFKDHSSEIDESQRGTRYDRYWVKYTFKIMIREGRFKYVISSIIRDKYLINDFKTISDKKKRLLSKDKDLTSIEELIINNLYDKRGKLNVENAYLKLKLIKINSEMSKNLREHINSQAAEDDW